MEEEDTLSLELVMEEARRMEARLMEEVVLGASSLEVVWDRRQDPNQAMGQELDYNQAMVQVDYPGVDYSQAMAVVDYSQV